MALIYSRFDDLPLFRIYATSPHFKKVFLMTKFASLLLIVILTAVSAWSQGKGVDKTSERVRDSGTAGRNGTKKNTGTGAGIEFCGGRKQLGAPPPYPYPNAARREGILQTGADAMRERKMVVR